MKLQQMLKVTLAAIFICGMTASTEAATPKKSVSNGKTRSTATRKTTSTALPKVTASDIHKYGDDLTTRKFTVKKGESVISIEYPISGNAVLVEQLKKYIADHIYIPDGKGQKLDYRFGVDETPESFLQKAIKPYKSKGRMGMDGETIEQDISVSYTNDYVVTLNNNGYIYAGGTHGAPWDLGTSFLKTDGTKLTYAMLPAFQTMKSTVEAGVAKFLDISIRELHDLTGGEIEDYPGEGEEVTPYVDADGLVIQYGAYEIGPYSMGMPKAVISKDTMRQICSGKALKFIQ